MKVQVVRKINNNAVLCTDKSRRELIAIGKGLGFGALPREIGLDEIERTFYDVDSAYHKAAEDLPLEVINFAARLTDIACNELDYELNPNVAFLLADHISFAIQRVRRGIHVRMPLAYDVQQMYPVEYKFGLYALKRIRKEFKIGLPKEEAVGIALNLVNARAAGDKMSKGDGKEGYAEMLEDITEIVEEYFHIIVERDSFNYSRYATHLQYLFQRVCQHKEINSDNLKLYESLKEEFADVAACVEKIAEHIRGKWGCQLSEEERLYLILHINRICMKEGL